MYFRVSQYYYTFTTLASNLRIVHGAKEFSDQHHATERKSCIVIAS